MLTRKLGWRWRSLMLRRLMAMMLLRPRLTQTSQILRAKLLLHRKLRKPRKLRKVS